MAQGFTGPGLAQTAAQTAERRDTVQTRLEGAYKILGLCFEIVTSIEDQITGPQGNKPSGGTPAPVGLAAMAMAIGNEVERLRERLGTVMQALG